MMFWFKNKKIVLDCFTTDPFSFEYAPITQATKAFPKWWNNLPPEFNYLQTNNYEPTMKACRGFTDLFKNSFIIPFWGNLQINVSDDLNPGYEWRSNYNLDGGNTKAIVQHASSQFHGFQETKFQHIKFSSPWRLKTNKYVKFLMIGADWHKGSLTEYNILPGMLDFKYQSFVNINTMVECRSSPRIIEFQPNQPMVYLTPITEEQVEIKLHLVDQKELERAFPFHRIHYPWMKIGSTYSVAKKFISEYETNNKPKCPFGGGR